MVVELVKLSFQDGVLAEEAAWKAVVLILKGGGDYCGIDLVEVIWKAVTVIPNRRFTSAITYHNSLHGFRAGCGTGNATLEVKLIQQVAALREAVPQCDLPEPAQGLHSLGKVQVPGYTGGIWRGTQGPLTPSKILGEA